MLGGSTSAAAAVAPAARTGGVGADELSRVIELEFDDEAIYGDSVDAAVAAAGAEAAARAAAETQGDAKLHKEMRRQREKEAKKERKKEGKGKRGKKGAAAEVTSGLLSAEAERRMEENGGLQAAGLIRGVGQGMDGGADVHEEWD